MPETEGHDDVSRLRSFLHGRDVHCPLCRYNLRDLTQPQCPECRHDLQLTVGVTRPMFLWFLLAVSPCVFAGITAGLLLIPMTIQPLSGGGPPQSPIIAIDVLGWLSALGGLFLIRSRFAFLRQTPNRQRLMALGVWAIHMLTFVGFFFTMLIMTGGP